MGLLIDGQSLKTPYGRYRLSHSVLSKECCWRWRLILYILTIYNHLWCARWHLIDNKEKIIFLKIVYWIFFFYKFSITIKKMNNSYNAHYSIQNPNVYFFHCINIFWKTPPTGHINRNKLSQTSPSRSIDLMPRLEKSLFNQSRSRRTTSSRAPHFSFRDAFLLLAPPARK